MKLEFEGRTWQMELDEVDMRQGDVIAGYTGLSLMAWYKSLLDTDSLAWNKSVRCLYWLLRDMNGEPVALDANFAPLKLFAAFHDAMSAEQPAEAEPDPTRPADGSVAAPPGTVPEAPPRG